MAKLRKRRKEIDHLKRFAVCFFTLAFVMLIISSIFVNIFNTSLTMKIQNMNDEIEVLKSENQKLNIQIAGLENKDRVYMIAQDAGLNQNQDNVISIQGGY